MSKENVDIMLRGYDHFKATGDFLAELMAPDFVWDMSNFHGWPEQKLYEGLSEVRRFMREWTEPFEEWRVEVEATHDVDDDRVLAIMRQHGRARSSGMPVDMVFGQLYTLRDGKQTRMQMFSDPAEAMRYVGLEG